MKIYAITKICNGLLSIAILFILINTLGLDNYATYIFVLSTSSVICLVFSLGAERFITLEVPKIYESGNGFLVRKLFLILLIFRLAFSLLVGGLIFLSFSYFSVYKVEFSIFFCAVTIFSLILVEMLTVLGNVLSIHKNVSISVFVSTLTKVFVASAAIFLNKKLSVEHVIFIFTSVELICYIPIVRLVLQKTRTKAASGDYEISFSYVKNICIENYKSLLLSVYFMPMSVRMIVSIFFEPKIVAAFTIVQTVIDRVRLHSPIFLFQNIVESKIAKKKNGDILDSHEVGVLKALDSINSLFTLYFLVVGGYLVNYFVTLATNGKVTDVSIYFAFLSITLLVSSKFSILWSFLNLSGKITELQTAMALNALVTVPAGIFFANKNILPIYLLCNFLFFLFLIIYFYLKYPARIYEKNYAIFGSVYTCIYFSFSTTSFDYEFEYFLVFVALLFLLTAKSLSSLRLSWKQIAKD